jgi:hypothetical protein
MKKLLFIILCLVLIAYATTSPVTPKLASGMTKKEVITKCGKPAQTGEIKDKNGRTLESFIYKETSIFDPENPVITYVYFADDKVIYFGSDPSLPPEKGGIEKERERR